MKRTAFRKIRLDISDEGVKIVRDDFKYARTTGFGNNSENEKQPKALGTAGDCYSWNSCEEVRNGDFKIDLSGIADIDYSRTGQWKGQG